MSKRLENIPPLGWDRGRSSIHILRSIFGIDWEDMVQASPHSKETFTEKLKTLHRSSMPATRPLTSSPWKLWPGWPSPSRSSTRTPQRWPRPGPTPACRAPTLSSPCWSFYRENSLVNLLLEFRDPTKTKRFQFICSHDQNPELSLNWNLVIREKNPTSADCFMWTRAADRETGSCYRWRKSKRRRRRMFLILTQFCKTFV